MEFIPATAFGNEDFEVDDFDFDGMVTQLAELEDTLEKEKTDTKLSVRRSATLSQPLYPLKGSD